MTTRLAHGTHQSFPRNSSRRVWNTTVAVLLCIEDYVIAKDQRYCSCNGRDRTERFPIWYGIDCGVKSQRGKSKKKRIKRRQDDQAFEATHWLPEIRSKLKTNNGIRAEVLFFFFFWSRILISCSVAADSHRWHVFLFSPFYLFPFFVWIPM